MPLLPIAPQFESKNLENQNVVDDLMAEWGRGMERETPRTRILGAIRKFTIPYLGARTEGHLSFLRKLAVALTHRSVRTDYTTSVNNDGGSPGLLPVGEPRALSRAYWRCDMAMDLTRVPLPSTRMIPTLYLGLTNYYGVFNDWNLESLFYFLGHCLLMNLLLH